MQVKLFHTYIYITYITYVSLIRCLFLSPLVSQPPGFRRAYSSPLYSSQQNATVSQLLPFCKSWKWVLVKWTGCAVIIFVFIIQLLKHTQSAPCMFHQLTLNSFGDIDFNLGQINQLLTFFWTSSSQGTSRIYSPEHLCGLDDNILCQCVPYDTNVI